MKKLLIAGIDPGTTLGYALLDLNGGIVKTSSSRQLDMSSLIIEMIKEGKVIVVGTDKGKTPRFVEKLASKIGARLIRPEEDLRVEEKRELTKGYEFGNEHEKDALASAIYAFKRIRKLLRKVDVHLKHRGKEEIEEKVKEVMLKDRRMSISEAITLVEKPEEETEKKTKRKKTGKTKEEEYFEEDKVVRDEAAELRRKLEFLKNNINGIVKTKLRKVVRIKNQKINFLTNKIREQEQEIKKLNEEISKLMEIIKKSDKSIILKKLKNLSWDEVEKEELDKVIYVEDPNIFSEKSIGKINESVEVMICKKEMSKKVNEKFKVVAIDADSVDAQEENGIILINKEKLEKEKNKVNILKKVIEEYRETRR